MLTSWIIFFMSIPVNTVHWKRRTTVSLRCTLPEYCGKTLCPSCSNVIDIDQSKVLPTSRSDIGTLLHLPSQRMYLRRDLWSYVYLTPPIPHWKRILKSIHTLFKKTLPKHANRASHNGDSRNECLFPILIVCTCGMYILRNMTHITVKGREERT